MDKSRERRALIIKDYLARKFPEPEVPLDHKDPYTLLIAVLLSAQCTDVKVNQVTPSLFAKADNPYDMSKLTADEIREIIKPCGLSPQKSKAILELSKIIVNKHDGQVPQSFEELEALPGVGHKTASVVMVQAFGKPAFPIDTHIHRLATIWKLTNGKNVKQTEADLRELFPEASWAKLHLQIIYYGRTTCKANRCGKKDCPLFRQLFASVRK